MQSSFGLISWCPTCATISLKSFDSLVSPNRSFVWEKITNNEWAPHGMPLFLEFWRPPGPPQPLYFSCSGAVFSLKNALFLEFWRPPGPPQPLHFSCSGAVFSSKNTLFLEFWRPPGAPQPLHFSCSGGVFSLKNTLFLEFWRPPGPPGKGGWEPRVLQPPAGLTTYHKYTSILTKRKHKPQTAHTRSDQIASPARGRRTSPACGSCRRPLKKALTNMRCKKTRSGAGESMIFEKMRPRLHQSTTSHARPRGPRPPLATLSAGGVEIMLWCRREHDF